MIKYIKAFRKYLRNIKYLIKEEVLFKEHSSLMISDRIANFNRQNSVRDKKKGGE
ncbi:hypothetical protein [Arcobacter sp. AHV-9/2010]|uniref:hypothetical protein n=1 Tax=Arcobacter sp. AHV-9/2010 TaxID=2021861 RepID=UPI0013E9871B|nr:hypothetical protein [Arcobacter sp. CECT 9299]